MARKVDVRYIQFYTDGSAARKIEPQLPPKKKTAQRPIRRPQERQVIHVDPLAIAGIAVAAVMLVLMVVGAVQMDATRQEAQAMAEYVSQLQEDKAQLTAEFVSKYDPAEVEQQALAFGLVPVEQAQVVQITVNATQPAPEPTVWENIQAFFQGLFA